MIILSFCIVNKLLRETAYRVGQWVPELGLQIKLKPVICRS